MPRGRRKVALLVETSNTYARDLLRGLRAWMREHEPWAIQLSEQGRGASVPTWLAGWRGHGIIARVENTAIATALQATGLPVIDVSAALPDPVFPRVITDSEAVTQLAAEHLMQRGFRHFGYCGDPRFHWSTQRAGFFAEHLRRAGFECRTYAPRAGAGRRSAAEAEVRGIAAWLETLPKPAGVLACYDLRGQQVLQACQLAGVSVPDAVAVMGVHNDDLLCDLCDPPLTSVIPNAQRAGYVAAGLLARMMSGRRVPVEVHTIPPVGVAARQSTDVVAVADDRVAAAVRYIREHASTNLRVADVLRVVPMSRTLLERRFRRSLGCTPHEHIARTRLEQVKSLLAGSDLSIAEIAERMGIEHVEYLSAAFRRETGRTPGEYRAQHRRGGSVNQRA